MSVTSTTTAVMLSSCRALVVHPLMNEGIAEYKKTVYLSSITLQL
jgi:hypothetical protein